jgi:hypothetical protein
MGTANCFWCNNPLGLVYTTTTLNGVKRALHQTPKQNCASAYHQWRRAEDSREWLRLQLRVALI